jgi:hypothetical protein
LFSTKLLIDYERLATTTPYASFRAHFTDDSGDQARTHWILVEYPVVALGLLATALSDLRLNLLLDLAIVGEVVSVLIHKAGFAKLKGRLALCGVSPIAVMRAQLPGGGGKKSVQEKLLSILQSRLAVDSTRLSNLIIKKDADIVLWTADLLVDSLQSLTDELFTKACLDARLKPKDDRSQLELCLADASVESRLKELRRHTGTATSNVIFAETARSLGLVQSASVFVDSWRSLPVVVHDVSLLKPYMPRVGTCGNAVALETFLKYPELHQEVSLIMLGGSRLGKTELAKFLCLCMAVMYSPDSAYFIFAQTIDTIRENQSLMKPGVPVLLDDIDPDNRSQIIYSDLSMWKSILQVSNPSQNRARNVDLKWAARQPKVLTSNADSVDEWISKIDARGLPAHKLAVKMRVAELRVSELLYATRAGSSSVERLAVAFNSNDAQARLAELL